MLENRQTLTEWLRFVESQHPESVIHLGLERMKTMLDRLGIRFDCPVIIVAGTNGKGSTCAMLESIYRAAGYKTAMHTSPHMLRFNERACVNGVEVEDAPLIASFAEVDAARKGLPLTYFEFTALAILRTFQKAAPDVVILEIGLGGRLDAINALEPAASIVTTIGIDHEAFLGNTRDSIGWEKAHVYRQGKPAVCADRNPPKKLLQYAQALGCDLQVYGRDFDIKDNGKGLSFTGRSSSWNVPYPALRGHNQFDNAAGVLALVDALKDQLPVTEQAIDQGLETVRVRARFECVAKTPLTYLDVGHNPHAARVLAQNVKALPKEGRTLAVFGMLADKDMLDVVKIMKDEIDEWYIATLPPPRGATSELLRRTMLEAGVEDSKINVLDDIATALKKAQHEARATDTIIVFGSFVTVTATLPFFTR